MVLEEMCIVTKDDYYPDRKKMELGDRWIKIASLLSVLYGFFVCQTAHVFSQITFRAANPCL